MTRTVKPSHIDINKLVPSSSKTRHKFLIQNHKLLIGFLKTLNPNQHQQDIFAETAETSWCGTVACGLGWATLSGLFKGLNYVEHHYQHDAHSQIEYIPMINGELLSTPWGWIAAGADAPEAAITKRLGPHTYLNTSWEGVGVAYFGLTTTDDVFLNAGLSLYSLIVELEDRLYDLRREELPYEVQ